MSEVSNILNAKIGFNYTISATIHSVEEKEPKPGLKLIEITLVDDSGTLIATVFNQSWLLDTLKPNDKVAVGGKVEFNYGFKRMTNPFIHVLDDEASQNNLSSVVSIHPSNENISSSWVSNIVQNAFDYLQKLDSIIPETYVEKYKLMDYFEALRAIHFPKTMDELNRAKRSIKYSQVLLQQLNALKNIDTKETQVFVCDFFVDKIKKIVDASSLYKDAKGQTLMITPWSLGLAQYKKALEEKLGELHVAFQIIDDNTSKENRWKAIYDFKNGDLDLLIGTAALLNEEIEPKKLSLAIVDEKTSFEPSDLEKLSKLVNENCDLIYLTSRQMPNSLSCLLYPNSQVNKIVLRHSHECKVFVYEKDMRMAAYEKAVEDLKKNNQALIYTPNVEFLINQMQEQTFAGWHIGIIQDDMTIRDILKLIDGFDAGKIDVLICASNIDIIIRPKTDVCVIYENADRTSLSNLHQIRGFALLDHDNSSLHLISSTKRKESLKRLNLMTEVMDGETLVTKDLELRREGSTLGFDKWGFNALKLINVVRDKAIIETANKDAKEILASDPELKNPQNKLLDFEISRMFN